MAAHAQPLAILVVQLRRERALPHARRIGLHDPQHEINRARAHAGPGGGHARERVGGSHVGIGAEIDVEERPLRPLEEDALARGARLGEFLPDGRGIGQDLRRDLEQLRAQLGPVHRLGAEALAERVVVGEQPVEARVERRFVGEVGDADRAPPDLVLIGRSNATAGGADLGLASRLLANQVEILMQRQDERGILGDQQALGADLDALRAQLPDLGNQGPGIEHNAVADHRKLARPHDPRGKQRELVGDAVDHQGMARVVASLEPRDHIRPLREPVDDLAFALVAPLGAHDNHVSHDIRCSMPLRGTYSGPQRRPKPSFSGRSPPTGQAPP